MLRLDLITGAHQLSSLLVHPRNCVDRASTAQQLDRYSGAYYPNRIKMNLAMLAAKRFNNHNFYERISAFMDKYC